MIITQSFDIDQPVDKVWEFFDDVPLVAACVPGANLTDKVGDDHYQGDVVISAGPVKLEFSGELKIKDRNEAKKTLVLDGAGADKKGRGNATTQLDVGFFQRGATATQYVNGCQRLWFGVAEQAGSLLQGTQHDLRHAVMQCSSDQLGICVAELASHIECNAAFQALDFRQATVTGNIAGLARPGRNGAKPRQHQEQSATRLLDRHAWAVLQETSQYLLFIAGQLAGRIGKVGEFSIQTRDRRNLEAQLCKEFAVAKGRKGRSAAQDQHLRDSLGRGML